MTTKRVGLRGGDQRGPLGVEKRASRLASSRASWAAAAPDEGDQNPARLVLGTPDIIERYVRTVKAKLKEWGGMTRNQRGTLLVDAAMEEIKRLSIPPPRVGGEGNSGRSGGFYARHWAVTIRAQVFEGKDKRAIADAAATVLHEFEHLAETFVAAQYLAATGGSQADIERSTGIPSQIAKQAVARRLSPADKSAMKLGKECLFRIRAERSATPKTSTAGRAGGTSYDALVRARLRASVAAQRAAAARVAALEKGSEVDKGVYFRARDELTARERDARARGREYQMLGGEVGPWLITNLVRSAMLR